MKKLIICFLVLAIMIAGFVSAGICENIVARGNLREGLFIPGWLPYKDDRFNMYTLNSTAIGHITFEKGVITSINCTTISNPTFNVYLKDDKTISDIYDSKSPAGAYEAKKRAGDIRIEGIGFTKKTKGAFTNFGIWVMSWFGK